MARTSIRAILADPVQRRELGIRFIMSAQHMEGINTTREQAEAAYDRVQEEKSARSNRRKVPCAR